MTKTVAVLSKYSAPILTKLKELLPEVKFIEVFAADTAGLKTADIILGDYDLVGPHLYNLPKTKWYQGTWAGLDALLPHIKPGAPPQFPITRTSGDNFGRLMGEYVFANIVFCERNYFKVKENQKQNLWDESACPHNHRSMSELKIGILGTGSIGNYIGKTLQFLGASVFGFGRRATISLDSSEYKHLAGYYTKSKLVELLTNIDYLINVLPKTEETTNLLGNGILEHCKGKNVTFINIGRGNIIEESELIYALKQGWISGAILDVFEQEPLTKESPLWNMANVFITPHISGNSRPQDVAEKFKVNFERFSKNESLNNQVDFSRGY